MWPWKRFRKFDDLLETEIKFIDRNKNKWFCIRRIKTKNPAKIIRRNFGIFHTKNPVFACFQLCTIDRLYEHFGATKKTFTQRYANEWGRSSKTIIEYFFFWSLYVKLEMCWHVPNIVHREQFCPRRKHAILTVITTTLLFSFVIWKNHCSRRFSIWHREINFNSPEIEHWRLSSTIQLAP